MSNNNDTSELFNQALENIKNNDLRAGAELFEKILKIDPGHLQSNFYLGNIYAQIKNFSKAKKIFENIIKQKPQSVEAHNNLGLINLESGQIDEAKKYFERAIKINPDYPDGYNNLGLMFMRLGEVENAKKNYEKSIEINPENFLAMNNLGILSKNLGDSKNAEKYFKNAITINPKYLLAHINLMQLYERLNLKNELNDAVNEAEINFQNNPIVKLYKGKLLYKNQDFSEAIKNLESIKFNESQLTFEKNRTLAIAKSYDKIEKSDEAFSYFSKTNDISLKQKSNKTDKNNFLNLINLRNDYFNEFEVQKWKKLNSANDPIFMVGFPRSGTTLLDTILRSHPNIEVIEEKPLVEGIIKLLNNFTNGKLENLKDIDETKLEDIRNVYFSKREEFIKNKDSEKMYIDKMPLNIIYIGEILRVFPNAKFIFSLRHPCDCILSCFMQNFKLNDSMANFLNLEDSANLYNSVMNLWIKYTSIFSFKYHVLKYEDLVQNFEKSVKDVLEFLELNWADSILEFYKTAEKRGLISTPSYDQVNKPINTKAIDKWKRYEKYINNSYPILEPWIKKFEY